MAFNMDNYISWATRRIYLMLYPHILEDFMTKGGCSAVHADGNMIAGDATVTHLVGRAGEDNGSSKEVQYRQELERGDSTLSTARETGETGTLR